MTCPAGGPFISVCSTGRVPVTHVSSASARIDVSLDGITLTRTKAKALRRGVAPHLELGWDEVAGAEIQRTAQGRAVVRVLVVGAPIVAHHRDDPYAVKVPRPQTAAAHELVEQVNHEVETRRRWREESEHRTRHEA